MIPHQLTLKNFLSYRQASLDFRGLHVACVCGPNGAGKSSLLEAIAWAVWGQNRGSVEDDVIHQGAMEAQVIFEFAHHQQTYRILRSRRRNQGSALEFQIATPNGFRPLTQRGMRATQQLILQHLRLDYDTFINSAYLRQGRADEFMLKRPAERKQILADLLKLDGYDRLAEKAKEQSRQAKAEVAVLERTLTHLETQLTQRRPVQQQWQQLNDQQAEQQQAIAVAQTRLIHLRQTQQQRQGQQQQLALVEQQQQHLHQAVTRTQQALDQAQQTQHALAQTLADAETIEAGYRQLQQLQTQDRQETERFQTYQQLQGQRLQAHQAHQALLNRCQDRQRQLEAQIQAHDQQVQAAQQLLQKSEGINRAIAALRQAQAQLQQLDQRQIQVTPLLRRQQQIQQQINHTQAHLSARLDHLVTTERQLQHQQAQQTCLLQDVAQITHTLEHLQQRRAYQEQVRQKGLERRSFMEQLQAHQRNFEQQLADLDHNVRLLSRPNACCPLCDRPLDDRHWQLVQTRHQAQQREIQNEIWVIREQLAVSEREIQVLRQEYRDLDAELADYSQVLEQRGQIQARLDNSADLQQRLQTLETERTQLERCLQDHQYADDLHQELSQIRQQLAALDYDDRNHALVRGQVERLRWAELKQAELHQAQRRLDQLAAARPALDDALDEATTALAAIPHSPEQQTLDQIDRQLTAVNYQLAQHQALRQQIQAAQPFALQYQALGQAQAQSPQVARQIEQYQQTLSEQGHALAQVRQQQSQLQQQLADLPDCAEQITALEAHLKEQQHQRETALSQLGALQQQLQQFEQQQIALTQQQQALHQAQQQSRVYQELAQAFGSNGIQSLMIENLLPQLEAEANRLLTRLSDNQLHVQFITQRQGRSRQGKLIDTLDILIADPQGTRAYETYSGGEAFRVNFAIRLALARLLAQRAGTPLQMLIVDEGFGTQDQAGCERLIAALTAISPDFACILTVTHMPHFREAFQTRIDVSKTAEGSQLTLSA